MRIGGADYAPPPSQTGQADLRHPAFRSVANHDGLAQGADERQRNRLPSRLGFGPAHPFPGGPLP